VIEAEARRAYDPASRLRLEVASPATGSFELGNRESSLDAVLNARNGSARHTISRSGGLDIPDRTTARSWPSRYTGLISRGDACAPSGHARAAAMGRILYDSGDSLPNEQVVLYAFVPYFRWKRMRRSGRPSSALVVPYPPGGSTDVAARPVAEKLSKAFRPAVRDRQPGRRVGRDWRGGGRARRAGRLHDHVRSRPGHDAASR
jgi:hypothetical protein